MTSLDDRLHEAAGSLVTTREPPPFQGVRQRARRRRMMGTAGAVVVLAAVTFSAISTMRDHDRVLVANPHSTSTTVAPTTTTTTTTKVPVADLTDVTVYLIANEHLVAAGRRSSWDAVPDGALRELLDSPVGTMEHDLGFTSAIPPGTILHAVLFDGSTAIVDLSQQFESGGGGLSMEARVAQVVFTVTQFEGIDHVRFRIDGVPVSTIGGEGVDNVDRAAFANITPLILVESPTPGQTVSAPLHVRGMSNTFEAGVNYTLYDSSGAVLAEGYTTATAGTGTWGTFGFDIAFRVEHAEAGRLSVYENSAKDGSRVHETTVPLDLQP
jgi:germination protein M